MRIAAIQLCKRYTCAQINGLTIYTRYILRHSRSFSRFRFFLPLFVCAAVAHNHVYGVRVYGCAHIYDASMYWSNKWA